jgi:hypothetical protein
MEMMDDEKITKDDGIRRTREKKSVALRKERREKKNN